MKIAVASDHAGYKMKEGLIKYVKSLGHSVRDLGPDSDERCDYPDYAKKAAKAVSQKKYPRAILICGSGVGMAMTANKFRGVRAAQCNSIYEAEMSRKHNDSNICTLGSRIIRFDKAKKIVKVWLRTKFEGGRHRGRVKKIG
jgi:ribose 5-phosphate isomerase B